jgi:ParB family chromosome partitioning protein
MSEPTNKITRLEAARQKHAAGTLGKGEQRGTVDAKATIFATEGRHFVHIEHLVEDPKNERKTFRQIGDLAASIKEEGLLEPIQVTRVGSGRYLILHGHRRFRAIQQLGWDKVEVLVREPEEESKRRVKSLISNIQREDVPPLELAEGIQALIHEEGFSQDVVAKKIGKSKAWVSEALRILELPKALRDKVRTSELSLAVDPLVKIARLDDLELQTMLLDAVLEGATAREIRSVLSVVAPSKPKAKTAKRESAPAKPKRVYPTEHKAVVIVQATTGRLTGEQTVAALQDALKAAKKSQTA